MKFANVKNKILKSDKLFFTFLRSIVSSQAASWVDIGMGIILFSFFGVSNIIATALGAISGGIINCLINYKFTFHADGCSWRAVIVKYALVWIGSLCLNTFGTDLLYVWMSSWTWLEDIGFARVGFYSVARIITSLLVSWMWNFLLQRYFVYRPTRFDNTIIGITCIVFPQKKDKQKTLTDE